MAVRIRMKKLGRRHRPFYRICVMDQRSPRNGRVIEELGTYDPMVRETDARAILDKERVSYWLGVGAQPSEKVSVLIKKYGPEGTHASQQQEALARLEAARRRPEAPAAAPAPAAAAVAEAPAEESPAAEAPAAEEAPAEEKPAEE